MKTGHDFSPVCTGFCYGNDLDQLRMLKSV